MISTDEQRLVDALREYSEGRRSLDFPFDDMKFTMKSAADEIERLASFLATPSVVEEAVKVEREALRAIVDLIDDGCRHFATDPGWTALQRAKSVLAPPALSSGDAS